MGPDVSLTITASPEHALAIVVVIIGALLLLVAMIFGNALHHRDRERNRDHDA